MRLRLIITLCLSLYLSNLFSQDSISVINRYEVDYDFLYSQYIDVFSKTPSLLTEWKHDDWAYIGAGYDLTKGDFRNPQAYNSLSQLNILTESILKPETGNWIFHGKFLYSNGTAKDVHSNLSYHIGRNGSPYYILQKQPGDWNLQNYEFIATATNQITERLSLGFKVLYNGELSLRTIDTRNNQTSLVADLITSGSYKLSENNTLSLGLDYKRVKVQPKLSDKFQHDSNDLTYNRYLNAGLGTYVKNVNFEMMVVDKSLGLIAQWLNQSENSSYSAIYEFHSGGEEFVNERLTNIDEEYRILNYNYLTHKAGVSTLHRLSDTYLTSFINLKFIKGGGEQWSESDFTYINNYDTDILDLDFGATLYNPSSFLRRINVLANLHDESRFDKNYGYQFDYTNVFAGGSVEFIFKLRSVGLGFMIGGGYGKNLDYLNSPNAAADNIYVPWIANPLMNYLASDYIEVPAYIKFEIPVKTNLVEVMMTARHQYPVNTIDMPDALFDKDDNFRAYNISLKLYF